MTYVSNHQEGHIYFVTATICGWKPMFLDPLYSQIILDSFSWLRENQICKVFAFVIMPTHVHLLIYPETGKVSQVIQRFGSFTAHAILAKLRANHSDELLCHFRASVLDKRENYRIWNDIQAENIFSSTVAWQKIEYIHQNPARGDSPLVAIRSEYPYSSARFYDDDRPCIIPVDDIREFLSE